MNAHTEEIARMAAMLSSNKPATITPVIAKAEARHLDNAITLPALMAKEFPPARYVIDGFLAEGISLLAAKPKSGKSWLSLQIALAVAGGHSCFGADAVTARPVLLLALEDTQRRLQDRARKLLAATGWKDDAKLTIQTEWPKASAGGLATIAEWLLLNRGGLIVVDTLQRFRDAKKSKGDSYELDYEQVANLQTVINTYGASCLVIHHTRKSVGEDPFDDISGTNGISGGADSLYVIRRTDNTAKLYAKGRDLSETTFSIDFNPESCLWSMTGKADGIEHGPASLTRNESCAEWLASLLGLHSWPDEDLKVEARRAGFNVDHLQKAKTILRQQKRLASKQDGFQGPWLNWLGTKDKRPELRPTPDYRVPM